MKHKMKKSEKQCPKCHDMMHDMGVHYHNGHDRRKWECFNCGYTTYGSHTELGLHRNVNKMKKSSMKSNIENLRNCLLDLATYFYNLNPGSKTDNISNEITRVSDELYYIMDDLSIDKGKVRVDGEIYEIPDSLEDKIEFVKQICYSIENEMNIGDYDDIRERLNESLNRIKYLLHILEDTESKSTKKMKKSMEDIPNQFYINLTDGKVLTFVKEDYPMGVRWLCSDDYRFYSDDGGTIIFPCMQTTQDGRMLFLFEEEGWADDYDGEYSDATGINAVIEFEEYINNVLASGVYIDYGDEDIMESTKKSTLSIHDMIAQTRANNNSLTKNRVELAIVKDIDYTGEDFSFGGQHTDNSGEISSYYFSENEMRELLDNIIIDGSSLGQYINHSGVDGIFYAVSGRLPISDRGGDYEFEFKIEPSWDADGSHCWANVRFKVYGLYGWKTYMGSINGNDVYALAQKISGECSPFFVNTVLSG